MKGGHVIRLVRGFRRAHVKRSPKHVSVFRHAPVACVVLDRDGTVVDANDAAASLLRVDQDALVGAPLARSASIENPSELLRHLGRCFEERGRVSSDLTFFIADRGATVLEAVSTAIAADDDESAFCVTMLHDVTKTRRSGTRLKVLARAGDALACPVDSPPSPVEIVRLALPALADACFVDLRDDAGDVRRVEVMCSGRRATEVSERLWRQSGDPAWRARRASILESGDAVFEPSSASIIGEALAHDLGATAAMIVPIAVASRCFGVLGFVMIDSACPGRHYEDEDFEAAQDLARRLAVALDNARVYELARNKVQAQHETLTSVAHDLRQPLSAIIGCAAVGSQCASGDLGRSLEAIHRAASRMNRLVSDLLDISSIETGRLSLDCHSIDVVRVVREIAEMFSVAARTKHVALRVATDGPLEAFGDPDRVAQVVSNLVDNAIKFTPQGGDVQLSAEAQTDCVRVAVTDSGPGIPQELVPHVFERYWRATDGGRGGHGLGLSIAHTIVAASRGTIGVESKVGEGSTFFFTLPRTRS